MDLIERVFGVWPDGGDGSLELLVIVAAVVAIGIFVFTRSARRTATKSSPISMRLPL